MLQYLDSKHHHKDKPKQKQDKANLLWIGNLKVHTLFTLMSYTS